MLDDSVASTRSRIAAVADALFSQETGGATAAHEDLREIGLTSLNMVNLMLAIEAEFGLEIPKRDLHPDNFRTLTAIEDLVVRLTSRG